MSENLKHIIESLLFIADEPLNLDRIKKILPDAAPAELRQAVDGLVREYAERKGGFYLKEVAGGYQFRTHSEYNTYIRRMVKPNAPRLSKAALETLAVIAYKQPVIRSDVEHIRGVDCGGVLRMLLERKLIRILGRKEIPGRPLIYATTKMFLEVFDLKDLKDLPSPKEIEEMGDAEIEKLLSESGENAETPAQTQRQLFEDGREPAADPAEPAPENGENGQIPDMRSDAVEAPTEPGDTAPPAEGDSLKKA